MSREGLLDSLRRLGREKWYGCGDQTFRLGLAEGPWQLGQAGELVARQQGTSSWQLPPEQARENDDGVVILALGTRPQVRTPHQPDELWALGTVSLRRDTLDGVLLDPRYERALLDLAVPGSRLVSLQGLALAPSMIYAQVLEAMLDMVEHIAVEEWGATDLLVSCDSRLAALYCQALGFTRCIPQGSGEPDSALLHLSAARLHDEPVRARMASNDGAALHAAVAAEGSRAWRQAQGGPLRAPLTVV